MAANDAINVQTLTNQWTTKTAAELTESIRGRYRSTEFSTELSGCSASVLLTAVVDGDDRDEAVDSFIDRVLARPDLEDLPLHVIPIRTATRRERLRAAILTGQFTID